MGKKAQINKLEKRIKRLAQVETEMMREMEDQFNHLNKMIQEIRANVISLGSTTAYPTKYLVVRTVILSRDMVTRDVHNFLVAVVRPNLDEVSTIILNSMGKNHKNGESVFIKEQVEYAVKEAYRQMFRGNRDVMGKWHDTFDKGMEALKKAGYDPNSYNKSIVGISVLTDGRTFSLGDAGRPVSKPIFTGHFIDKDKDCDDTKSGTEATKDTQVQHDDPDSEDPVKEHEDRPVKKYFVGCYDTTKTDDPHRVYFIASYEIYEGARQNLLFLAMYDVVHNKYKGIEYTNMLYRSIRPEFINKGPKVVYETYDDARGVFDLLIKDKNYNPLTNDYVLGMLVQKNNAEDTKEE